MRKRRSRFPSPRPARPLPRRSRARISRRPCAPWPICALRWTPSSTRSRSTPTTPPCARTGCGCSTCSAAPPVRSRIFRASRADPLPSRRWRAHCDLHATNQQRAAATHGPMKINPTFGSMISRRALLAGLAVAPLAACNTAGHNPNLAAAADEDLSAWYTGYMPDGEHQIPLVDKTRVKPQYRRQTVAWAGGEKPGTIVVDIDDRLLYLVQDGGTAIRYGVGVGRQGFSWRGTARVGRKGVWPDWSPTTTMVSLKPDLPRHMKGGIENPLGARALYLYQDDRDILFRIHGTNEPWSIGQAVSSGCIRMLNEDIHDLYNRVPVGTTVMVRRNGRARV